MWYKCAKGKHTSIMIALYPNKKDAKSLEQDNLHNFDAESSSDLHITLALIENSKELEKQQDIIKQMLESFASRWKPLNGQACGLGYFDIPDGDVIYMNFDCPELPDFRHDLIESLHSIGVEEMKDHGWTPHLSLGYASKNAFGKDIMPLIDFDPGIMTMNRLVLKWADAEAGEWKLIK